MEIEPLAKIAIHNSDFYYRWDIDVACAHRCLKLEKAGEKEKKRNPEKMGKNGEGFDVGGESLVMLHEFSRNFEKFESTMKEDGTL